MPDAQRHVSHGLLCDEARRRMASAGDNSNGPQARSLNRSSATRPWGMLELDAAAAHARLYDGASRTRTGDLLGAITPLRRVTRPTRLAQAVRRALSSVGFSQFGSTVSRTSNPVVDARQVAHAPMRTRLSRLFVASLG
jgi:hypothetical protein